MTYFKSTIIAALSCATGIMAFSATTAQAGEVRWNCGNRFGPSTTVSLNSGGAVPLVQWSTSDWRTWARAAEAGCRPEAEPSSSPRISVDTTPSRVYVEPVEVNVPDRSSVTINVDSDPSPAALW
jgi:hypothetical protein